MKRINSTLVAFAMGLVTLLTGCATTPGYTGAHGEDKLAVYNKVKLDLTTCPNRVEVARTPGGGGSFSTRTTTVNIGETVKPADYDAVLAHETVHLCLVMISNGASVTDQYRFLDEGFAKLYDRRMRLSEDSIARLTYGKLKKYPAEVINFKQARSWSSYFGKPDSLGTLGWDAYYVGVSFHLFLEDTYGKSKPLKLMREIGLSMSFAGALKDTVGEDIDVVEKKWQDHVARGIANLK